MDLRECCGSDQFCFISWSNHLAGMAGPDDLFNLFVHVEPPHLLSESGRCAHHSLMALMEKLYRTLPEALWHYSAKVLVMLFLNTANYSHIAM